MSLQISDITSDPALTPAELLCLTKFRALVESLLEEQKPPGSDWKHLSMFHLCDSVGVDLSSLPKEGQMLSALWVIVLRGIRKYLNDSELKYPQFSDFTSAYTDAFPRDDENEIRKLWQVANWMNVLFKMIPAKKNKGLAMLVAPRFVEGWHVKYVTGSGQTHYTANRVKVFETEGDTKAAHRGKLKMKPKKKGDSGGDDSDDQEEGNEPTRESSISSAENHRKRKITAAKKESVAASADNRGQKKSKLMPPPPIPGRCTTDVLRSASNEDCREAYKEFQSTGVQRDETALLIPDLMRSDSWINPSGAGNMISSIPGPIQSERNITWGEIPVNTSSLMATSTPINPFGLSALSNGGSFSLGSVFLNNSSNSNGSAVPTVKFDGSDLSSAASPSINSNIFGVDKLSEVFGGFVPNNYKNTFQMNQQDASLPVSPTSRKTLA